MLLSLALVTVAVTGPAGAQVDRTDGGPGDNGFVMMVHGTFEPAATDRASHQTPDPVHVPPVHEIFGTTQDEGQIVLRVIPHSAPSSQGIGAVDVSNPTLALSGQLPGQQLTTTPTEANEGEDARCTEETELTGSPISACLIARVPAEDVRGWGAVDLELTFTSDGMQFSEPYSIPAHLALHAAIEGDAVSFDQADTLSGQPTPYLVEDLVDPVQ